MNFSDTSQISLLYRFDILHNAYSKTGKFSTGKQSFKTPKSVKNVPSQMLRTNYYAAELDNLTKTIHTLNYTTLSIEIMMPFTQEAVNLYIL